MPVFLRSSTQGFPPSWAASEDGLLAVGGDLSLERLVTAYGNGIFPWYDKGTPILWWNPPERCMLHPTDLHIPKSLRRVITARRFSITVDTAFTRVIGSCARALRPGQNGTWLVPEMVSAYTRLHMAGFAHSVEAWQERSLAGGLYGVALGGCFFGESMFFAEPDASKVSFIWLMKLLEHWGFSLIDCQQVTGNLLRFGAYPVPRETFMAALEDALRIPGRPGKWTMPEDFFPL